MKRLLSVFTIFFFSIFSVISSYASLRTPSNAVQVVPVSSLGIVKNTVDFSGSSVAVFANGYWNFFAYPGVDGSFNGVTDFSVYNYQLQLSSHSLPSSGVYNMSVDFTSDASMDIDHVILWVAYHPSNAEVVSSSYVVDRTNGLLVNSGDFLFRDVVIDFNSPVTEFNISVFLNEPIPSNGALGGKFAINFNYSSSNDPDLTTPGRPISDQDYDQNVSNSLNSISGSVSDISSGISDIESGISEMNQSLDYISQSQNLIIQGIDNVILHISDQLYAFWDQLYNLIHVPTYAILEQILQAINDLDINIEVDLGEIKTAIQNQTSSLLSQLTDSTVQIGSDIDDATDQVVNGYDPSGIESDNERLDQVINEYDDVESELFDDSKDYISGFDFEDGLDQYLGPLQDISGFLGGIYTTLAGLNIPIGFSLTLTIALLFIGYYRFKGGG